jgi:hypothetical protein
MKLTVPQQALKVRESKEKEIASIFMKYGYGLHIARNVLRYEITPNIYNSLLSSMVRSAIRRTCDILTKNLHKKDIKPFNR